VAQEEEPTMIHGSLPNWRAATTAAALTWTLAAPNSLADEPAATRVCARVAPIINALIDFAETACVPGREAGGYTLMIVTKQTAVAGTTRRSYLLTVVAAVGKELDTVGTKRINAVAIMDRQLATQRKYLRIPVTDVLKISRDLRADLITLDQMYAAIEESAKVVDLPKN